MIDEAAVENQLRFHSMNLAETLNYVDRCACQVINVYISRNNVSYYREERLMSAKLATKTTTTNQS